MPEILASLAEANYRLTTSQLGHNHNHNHNLTQTRNAQNNLYSLTMIRRRNRIGRQQRTRKQRAAQRSQPVEPSTHYQYRMTDYIDARKEQDNDSGHIITSPPQANVIRVYLQNPNGVQSKKAYLDDHCALMELRDLGADIIGLPETNQNWKHPYTVSRWTRQVRRVWPHAKVFTSSITTANRDRPYNRGGVSLIITNKWSSRVVNHGSDDLGRWSWVKLRGKLNQHLFCVVMYRPNIETVTEDHLLSAWNQQYHAILQSHADSQQYQLKIDPREQCLTDL